MQDRRISADEAMWMDGFTGALEEFRKWNPDVTANVVLTFMLIARHPGITQKELMKRLGLADSGTSRTTAALSRYGDRNKPGWDVIDLVENPLDRREKLLYLNKKGNVILAALRRALLRR